MKEKNFYNHYIIFRKVSEDFCWPGHIVPVVQVYKWIGKDIPAIESLVNKSLLEQRFYPNVLESKPNKKKEFKIKLLSTSQNVIPKDNLSFLGNIPGDDLIPFRGYDYWTGYTEVGWESSRYNTKFEHYIIDMYLAWKDIQ